MKLTAQSLRNGNWLHSELTNKDFQVNPDDIRSIWLGYDRGMVKPIPLTQEWILKFGFEKDYETNSWSILIPFDNFDYLFEISNKYQEFFQPEFLRINIMFVHQLQNLVFALTGYELTTE